MDKRNQGIAGVLFAYVAQDAFNRGFEGFMMLISKTALRDFMLVGMEAVVLETLTE